MIANRKSRDLVWMEWKVGCNGNVVQSLSDRDRKLKIILKSNLELYGNFVFNVVGIWS
jgi:hypothetical protein